MTRRAAVLAAFVAACGIVSAGVSGQASHPQEPQQPTFRAGTLLVPLDVRVVDKSGHPVSGLTKEDFVVTENGVPEAIEHFSEQHRVPDVASTAPLARRLNQASPIQAQPGRIFLLYLGRGDLTGPLEGTNGVVHFVKDRLLPQDYVAALAWNRATDFTTDHGSVLAVLERYKGSGRKVERALYDYLRSPQFMYGDRKIPSWIQKDIDAVFTGPGQAPMRSVNAQMSVGAEEERRLLDDTERRLRQDLSGTSDGTSLDDFLEDEARVIGEQANLFASIEYLKHLEGEKHLIWLTEYGLPVAIAGSDSRRVEDDMKIGRAAADARVVVDVVTSGGTKSTTSCNAEVARPGGCYDPLRNLTAIAPAQVSRIFADLTGGRSDLSRFPRAAMAFDMIDLDSRDQYLLGYYPSNQNWDGKFRNVAISVKRPGLTVLARHGYYAKPEVGPLDRRGTVTFARVAAAAEDAREIPDMGLDASAFNEPAQGRVSLTMTVDLSRVLFEAAGGRLTTTLHVAAFCLDQRQRPVGQSEQDVELNYDQARLTAMRTAGLSLTVAVPVTAPADSLKLVVYDFAGDLTGSRNVPVGRGK